MIIRKSEYNYTVKDIGLFIKEANTIKELEYLYENIKKDLSISEKNKNLLLTMIPFKMASIGIPSKIVSK